MLCSRCAYPNPPPNAVCTRCGYVLQSPQEAAQRQKLWDELPPKARSEFEEKFRNDQLKYEKWITYLKQNRIKHIVMGGLLLGILGLLHGFVIISDIMLGGLAGWLLNIKRGGAYWGLLFFGAGYSISALFKGLSGLSHFSAEVSHSYGVGGIALLLICGALFTLCLGYAFGMAMEMRHLERGV